jgi:hypothetical protein
MAYVLQLQIQNVNELLQVNDNVYYIPNGQNSGLEAVLIGACSYINADAGIIRVSGNLNINPPTTNDYVFFTKDNAANQNKVKGYYAEVKMINNNSNDYSELFQVGLGIEESSK